MSTTPNEAIHPMEREGCWLCDGCGEVETHKASDDQRVAVGCPACIQNDLSWKLQAAETERDELAAWKDDMVTTLDAPVSPERRYVHARTVASSAPSASLARRDARMKAEVLEESVKETGGRNGVIDAEDIELIAAEYRQQAEGMRDD